MKKFIKTHKKPVIIGVSVFVLVLILLVVWLFVLPSFNGNKYGDRLKEEVEHPNNLPEIDSATSVWISVSKLIKDGYISNDDVANPKGDIKNMNGCVEVKYESNQYTYSYKPECPSLQK